MKINLLSHDNGVGLTQDVRIVKSILNKHEVKFIDLRHNKFEKADVNIFFEILDGRHYDYARHNLFFPNPEWFWWPKQLAGIDIVLAKTKDAKRIFEAFPVKVEFTSFTSDDRFDIQILRDRAYLHMAGQSETKGTQTVFANWERNYPQLVFTKLKNFGMYQKRNANVIACFERMPLDLIRTIQNKCVFHICPSEYEGFGHYIWEAKSCGAITLTTDGAPMNEMVTDGVDGFLIKANAKKKMNFAKCSLISGDDFRKVIEKTTKLTDNEILDMRKASRNAWVDNDTFFRTRLNEIIDTLK